MSATRYIVSRRVALGLAAGPLLTVVPGARVSAQRLDRVSYITNWRAQAEHGGFYQAQAAGLYRARGLEVELRQGGPQLNPTQLMLAGRVDMAMSNGIEAFSYVQQNIPFLCIAGVFQKDMQVLIAHPDTGVTGFESLRGRPLLIGTQARATWWPFVRQKYGLRDEQVRPYTFNLQPFMADRQVIQQGYLGSEPFSIREQGVNPVTLLVHDAGFENYGTTIMIGRRTMEEKRDAIARFVDASMEGWDQYLKGPAGGFDTAAANAMIKRENTDMTDALIAFGTRMMNEAGIVRSGDAATLGIGAMTEARWRSFHAACAQVGVVPADLDWRRAFALDFVNKGIGRA